MTLDQAIEELNTLELPNKTEQDHNKHLAVRLGTEALKALKKWRQSHSVIAFEDDDPLFGLPDETEE